MIRTRDVILYLSILGFIVLGAVHTGLANRTTSTIATFFGSDIPAEEVSAFLIADESDPTSRWQELRERLAAGDGYAADAPAVFTSVDQIARAEATSTEPDTVVNGDRAVQWCGSPLPNMLVGTWPTETELTQVEGQRVITSTVQTEVTIGTSTETVTETATVATLPVRSVRSTFESCLPDTLIGVTPTGQPLTNDQAPQYTNTAPTTLLGYSRDGFAVYGPVSDPSVLDVCGGQYVNGNYQYHIRSNESFILGCYAGVPVQLN